MNVAIVIHTFPPYPGGTGNVAFHNAVGLAKRGHEVSVYTSRYPDEPHDYPDEIDVHRIPPTFRLGNAPFIPQLLLLDEFDLIHLHHPYPMGASLVAANARMRGTPLVITHHQDLGFPGLLNLLLPLYDNTIKRAVFETAARIVVPTVDYAYSSKIAEHLFQSPEKFVEVPNGVDTDHFTPNVDPEPIVERYGIPTDELLLTFVGTLDRPHFFKGVDVLLRALARLPKGHLVIVGSGPLESKYATLAERLGIGHRVTFTGFVPDDDLAAVYNAADVHVLPSVTKQEIFGLVLVEAMACGTPVVASDLPGVRTVVEEGRTGFLAEPGNPHDLAEKLEIVLTDSDRRVEMGENARGSVKRRYDWDVIAESLEEVYESVR